ncbi:hypothetical protein ColLi_02826 [Colletotrichum liriopes]|uniref:Uncharacterized protein n=1 Tax=Colletotrichum liriopes TaxID=708192 RepID=A0AA37GGM4_9PEZI|nr:hypothetical protein ColLi_02826 [Colletotrichum liriopes]
MATRHHHTTNGGIGNRRAARNAAFQEKIRQMRLPLAPLVQILTTSLASTTSAAPRPVGPQPRGEAYVVGKTAGEDAVLGPSPAGPRIPFQNPQLTEPARGCDTPIRIRIKTEEQIMEEARQARLAEDEAALRRKMPWYS